MNEMKLYELWKEKATEDIDLQNELDSIKNDTEAINDRFYRSLEFGTGGLRGRYRRRHIPSKHLYHKKGNSGTCRLCKRSV